MAASTEPNQDAQAPVPTHADVKMEHSLTGAKRKEPEVPKRKTSFKAVGNLVLAMKRFSNALNPTYSYGKRTTSTSSGGKATEDKEAVESTRPISPGHTEDTYAYQDHGHRFDFLIKPLPPTEEEEATLAKQ